MGIVWTALDSKKTLPEVGRSSAKRSFKSVDLPAPDWPTMEINSFGTIEKETSSRAIEVGEYIFETLSNDINGLVKL